MCLRIVLRVYFVQSAKMLRVGVGALLKPNIYTCAAHLKYSATKNVEATLLGPQYCVNIVQQYDYENFLCTLLLKGEQRRFAFAVRALNVEVSRISSMVTEDITGRMRLQFWKDSIDDCYDSQKAYVLDHPVLREIKTAIDKHKLNKVYLKRLIASRDRPANRPFVAMKDLEDYAEQTVSTVYYILLQIFGKKDMNIDHAISHLGKAQGIANLLRAIPHHSRNAAVNIPQEILMKHGVSQERIIRDKANDKGVEECVFDVATAAHQHLEKARNLSKHVPRDVVALFLPAIAIERYLDRLRRAKFRLSDGKLQQRDQFLPIAYYWHKFRGKY